MSSATLTLAALKHSDRHLALPFSLDLPDGSTLHCETLLRFLPNKRWVLRATHHGIPVLAKIFFDTANWKKEVAGYSALQATGITTPTQLFHCTLEQGGICLYHFIDHAQPLDTLWSTASDSRKRQLLTQLYATLETLWQHQWLQRDLHLGNFLLQDNHNDEVLWLLDPASCHAFHTPQEQKNNLALLLAQLPLTDWPLAIQQLSLDNTIVATATQCWQQRLQHYLPKTQRDCTEIANISNSRQLRVLCRRDVLSDALRAALLNPLALSQQAAVLKNGNSAKVFLIDLAGKKFVIKQYINKDWLRKLRRAFRPSRAARSWRIAHAFRFAGIAVPTPIALVEQQKWGVVTQAWFISEYCEDKNLLELWRHRSPYSNELTSLQTIFNALKSLHISHGDMKATNLLSDGHTITVIDYDGAREHQHERTLHLALQKDKQRLLQNWKDNPVLQQHIVEHIAL